MRIFESMNIADVYKDLVVALKSAKVVGSTKEINNCCLIVHNPNTNCVYFPNRQISEDYANAELAWYWSADNSCETIGKHAKMWLRLSDDGMTNNSAYGYIIHKKYGFDQLQQIIELLRNDPTTRRAVLNISDPAINRITTKDMQCTIALQFLIRDEQLEMTVYMRSNDIYFGLPYDYIYFVSIGEYIAKQLNRKLSLYTHHATSMHMYLKDEEKFKQHFQVSKFEVDKIIERNYDDDKTNQEHS